MENIWETLPKPFFCLAPMEGVTDIIFRQVVARAARPDLFFTEFTNVSSFANEKGRKNALSRLKIAPSDSPIIAQIWGKNPAHFSELASALQNLGFSGIDLNFGCPDKNVNRAGGGAAMIKTPDLAVECLRNAKNNSNGLPVSVKTRLGFSFLDNYKTWLPTLLKESPAALTVHLRTRKEMSKVPAHFELIPELLALREKFSPETKLIINGDLETRADCERLYEKFPNLDGFMIGRGVFKNPFCFASPAHEPTREELMDLLKFHLDLYDREFLDSFSKGLPESSLAESECPIRERPEISLAGRSVSSRDRSGRHVPPLGTRRALATEEEAPDTLGGGLAGRRVSKGTFERKPLTGYDLFKLQDTYGFPFEISVEEIYRQNIPLSENYKAEFDAALAEQRERSKTASKGMFKGGLEDHGEQTTKYHTATHLLLASLQKHIDKNICQKGSNITADRLRFDFNLDHKMTKEELETVENQVNAWISEKLPVSFAEYEKDYAKNVLKAHGQFWEKYPEKLKVYTIGDFENPVSREVCGGPHVENTSVLGTFKIKKEESSSAGIRRIKAVLE